MTESKPFGNLTFSRYTLETDAERCLLALQAALSVKGYNPSHPAMKKVLRLKRSMSRSKIRRYSFNLIQAEVSPSLEPKPQVIGNPPDTGELLAPILERITGLALRSKTSKRTSSGHSLVSFVLGGKLKDCRIVPGTMSPISVDVARGEVARVVARELGEQFSSFSLQPFRIRFDESKGVIGLSIQCFYKVVTYDT